MSAAPRTPPTAPPTVVTLVSLVPSAVPVVTAVSVDLERAFATFSNDREDVSEIESSTDATERLAPD